MPRYLPGKSAPETQLATRIAAAVLLVLDEHNAGFFDNTPERLTWNLQLQLEKEITAAVDRWIQENGFND